MIPPCLHLEHPSDDNTQRVNVGEGGQKQVEAGGEEDGDAKKPIGGDVRGKEASRHLGEDVTPEVGGVNIAYGLWAPVELRDPIIIWCGVDFHHCNLNIASNAKGYEETNGHKRSLMKMKVSFVVIDMEVVQNLTITT